MQRKLQHPTATLVSTSLNFSKVVAHGTANLPLTFRRKADRVYLCLGWDKTCQSLQAVIYSDSSDRMLSTGYIVILHNIYIYILIVYSYHDNMSICSDPSLHEILAKLRTWSKPTVNQSWLNLTGHALDLDGNPTDEGWTQSTVHPELRGACPLGDTMDWETMSWLSHIFTPHCGDNYIYNYDVWMHVNLDTSRSDLVLLLFFSL